MSGDSYLGPVIWEDGMVVARADRGIVHMVDKNSDGDLGVFLTAGDLLAIVNAMQGGGDPL